MQTLQKTSQQDTEEFEKADMQKALEHWDKCCLRKFQPDGGNSKPLDKNFNRKELGKYSTGFQLYFKFIQWLAIFFGIACIPGGYLMYTNFVGNGYTQIRSPFDSFTLGNLPDYSNITTVLNTQGYDAWRDEIDKVNVELMIQQYVDLGISLLLFIFMMAYRCSSSREKDEIDLNNCNVSDYAIEINGIPMYSFVTFEIDLSSKSKEATELEVATHFGLLFGNVNQCRFARNYEGTMPYFVDIAELTNEKKRQEALLRAGLSKNTKKVLYLESRIEKLKKYVAKTLKARFGERILTHSDYPAVKAFLIFDSAKAQYRALRAFQKYQSVSFYKTVFCCWGSALPEKFKLFGKYNIRIKQADEPSSIKWENQDTTTCEAIARFLVVYLIVIICLIITFAFIIASNVLSYSAQLGAACTSGGTSSAASFQIFSSSSTVNCYCAGLSITQILESTSIRSTCSSYLLARSFEIGMSVASGVCIAIINAIIKQIFIGLARFQRYDTLSRESGATLIKYFLSLFINTAIIPILANSDVYGFELSKRLVELFIKDPSDLLDSTYPSDFDQSWYSQVGSKIMSPMIIAIFSPHLINLFLIPCRKCRMKRKAKKMVFQRDLNKLFTPPEFKISFCYAIAMNILFVSFTFSAGMPLLYASAFISLVFIYYTEKYIVARFCRKPPGYNSAQNDMMIKSIPFALLLHCLVAVWMYGCSAIFPYDPSSITWGHISDDNYGIIERVQRSFPHAVLAALALATIIIDNFLSPIFSAFSSQVEKDFHAKIDKKKLRTFRQEYQRLTELGVASYNMKANPEYHDVIEAMQLDVADDKELQSEEDNSQDVQNATAQNISAQRFLTDKNPSQLPDTDIVPDFTRVNPGMMLGESPLIKPLPPQNSSAKPDLSLIKMIDLENNERRLL